MRGSDLPIREKSSPWTEIAFIVDVDITTMCFTTLLTKQDYVRKQLAIHRRKELSYRVLFNTIDFCLVLICFKYMYMSY